MKVVVSDRELVGRRFGLWNIIGRVGGFIDSKEPDDHN